MKIGLIVVSLMFGFLLVYGAGCGSLSPLREISTPASGPADSGKTSTGALEKTLKVLNVAPATVFVSEAMRPYLSAGLGLCMLGVFAMVFGGRVAGVIFFVSGVMVTILGVGMMMYPWVTLIAFAGVALTVIAGLLSWRNERKLKATIVELEEHKEVEEIIVGSVEVAKSGKDVKAAIKNQGSAVAQKVRKIVDPIKANLARAQP